MDVKLFVWKAGTGYWFLLAENDASMFSVMQPISDKQAERMIARGVPQKVIR